MCNIFITPYAPVVGAPALARREQPVDARSCLGMQVYVRLRQGGYGASQLDRSSAVTLSTIDCMRMPGRASTTNDGRPSRRQKSIGRTPATLAA